MAAPANPIQAPVALRARPFTAQVEADARRDYANFLNAGNANQQLADVVTALTNLNVINQMDVWHAEETAHDAQVLARQAVQGIINNWPAPANQGVINELKIEKPKNFDGTRSMARPFLNSVQLYMDTWHGHNNRYFADDASKIRYVLSLLEGKAKEWATPIEEELLRPMAQGAQRPARCPDWNVFKTLFQEMFFDPDQKASWRRELMGLRQTGSLLDFLREWERITGLLGYNNWQMLYGDFLQRIKPKVHAEMIKSGIPEMPEELPANAPANANLNDIQRQALEDTIEMAKRMDKGLYQAYLVEKGRNQQFGGTLYGMRNAPSPSGQKGQYGQMRGTAPMTRNSGPQFQNQPPVKQEPVNNLRGQFGRQERAQNIQCFACRQWGHYANKCPNRVINNMEGYYEEPPQPISAVPISQNANPADLAPDAAYYNSDF
jgi:hypothetical protein